jgi:gamma-glutamyltranspeptidase/glutathione hydrolase
MIKLYRNLQYYGIIIFLSSLLGACGSNQALELGNEGYVEGFTGGVSADEPRAALEGQKILSAGGNAVDAAIAVYFTLAVTLPSKASLGGGGICMVFDHKTRNVLALDFLNKVPANIPASASRPSAVPGNPLGMFVLHNRFGSFQWESLVAIGEKLARLGTTASRVLINDLKPVGAALMADPGSRRVFLQTDGNLIVEGALMRQIDLAAVLSNLKQSGPAGFYRGKLARRFVEGVKKIGGSLSLNDLMAFKPKWKKVLTKKFGHHEINFMPPPASGGLVSAQMFGMLKKNDLFEDASTGEKYHILAETALRSFIDRERWLRDDFSVTSKPKELITDSHVGNLISNYRADRHLSLNNFKSPSQKGEDNPSATSFVVVDRDGSAVACSLTMNNDFGVGRMAKGTGILLATAPTSHAKGPTALIPIIVRNKHTNNLFFVGAASGGIAAPTALINVISRAMIDNMKLGHAISAPRVHHSGMPDITFYEPHLPEKIKLFLIQRGHKIAATPVLGVVNAAYCSGGLPRDPESCVIKSDLRGGGLATTASE